jgi:hypothetical protein
VRPALARSGRPPQRRIRRSAGDRSRRPTGLLVVLVLVLLGVVPVLVLVVFLVVPVPVLVGL